MAVHNAFSSVMSDIFNMFQGLRRCSSRKFVPRMTSKFRGPSLELSKCARVRGKRIFASSLLIGCSPGITDGEDVQRSRWRWTRGYHVRKGFVGCDAAEIYNVGHFHYVTQTTLLRELNRGHCCSKPVCYGDGSQGGSLTVQVWLTHSYAFGLTNKSGIIMQQEMR